MDMQKADLFWDKRSLSEHKLLMNVRDICHRIGTSLKHPMIVNVGANDGVTGDLFADIVLSQKSWHGLLIEPVPALFQRLKKNYKSLRFTKFRGAISDRTGVARFYYIPGYVIRGAGLPDWYDQIGGFDIGLVRKQMHYKDVDCIEHMDTLTMPLSSLLQKYCIRHVDVLHIDTEGHDYKVLQTIDLQKYTPTIVMVEIKHLAALYKRATKRLLQENGYTVFHCGPDLIGINYMRAINREQNQIGSK